MCAISNLVVAIAVPVLPIAVRSSPVSVSHVGVATRPIVIGRPLTARASGLHEVEADPVAGVYRHLPRAASMLRPFSFQRARTS